MVPQCLSGKLLMVLCPIFKGVIDFITFGGNETGNVVAKGDSE